MRPNNPILLNAVANSGTKLSSALDASCIYQGSVFIFFSDGAAAGTLSFQGSNDPFEQLPHNLAPQNWIDISTVTSASGASKSLAYAPATNGSFRWLRVKWVQSGGAGTVTVNGFFQGV